MILYHGSYVEIQKPDVIHSRENVDLKDGEKQALFPDIFLMRKLTLKRNFLNLIDKKEAITRLRYEKPNQQVCFRNQDVIDRYLSFKGSERL